MVVLKLKFGLFWIAQLTILVIAGCGSGGEADSSVPVTSAFAQRHGDRKPPSVPGNLSAIAISATEVDLAWSSSTDNVGMTGYVISRDGTPLARQGNVTQYKDTTVK